MANIYQSQTPGQFPIVALNLFNPDNSIPAAERVNNLKKVCYTAVNCGFNLALQSVSYPFIGPLLEAMQYSGLKLILNNGSYTDATAWGNLVNSFKASPSLAGWYPARLPLYSDLSKLKTCCDTIAANDRLVNSATGKEEGYGHLVFMQLLEGLSKNYTGDCATYTDYLRHLRSAGVDPMIWANNFNPVVYDTNGKATVHYDSFYQNLQCLRQISFESGNPFWAYCLCNQYRQGSTVWKATEASMRLQTFAALAYGAQGLIFTSYQQQANSSSITFSESPIDLDGNRTSRWYELRELIAEIHGYTDIFLGGQAVDIRHTGTSIGIRPVNYNTSGSTGAAFGPCESIVSGSHGMLLSLFGNKGRTYLVAVNHDVTKTQTVTFNFSKLYKVVEETPKTLFSSDKNEQTTGGTRATRTLQPGGCIIFRYE